MLKNFLGYRGIIIFKRVCFQERVVHQANRVKGKKIWLLTVLFRSGSVLRKAYLVCDLFGFLINLHLFEHQEEFVIILYPYEC
jgi:hypothetical protein